MKKTLAILILVLISMNAHALDIAPFSGPKPIAVLIQTDPWLMVIGSDTPMVAIYDDGQLIYLKEGQDKRHVYYHILLSADELAAIKKKISSFGDYSKMKRSYALPNFITDQPETRIYLDINGPSFVTSINRNRVTDTSLGSKQARDALPSAIKDLLAYLKSLDLADATPWEPPYVEVMIWRYDYAPDESIHWPTEWPGLESPGTLKRGDAYSIFLPGKQLSRLRDFLKTKKEKGAVEIEGGKWAMSFRYTFPGESVWTKAFRGNPEEKNPSLLNRVRR